MAELPRGLFLKCRPRPPIRGLRRGESPGSSPTRALLSHAELGLAGPKIGQREDSLLRPRFFTKRLAKRIRPDHEVRERRVHGRDRVDSINSHVGVIDGVHALDEGFVALVEIGEQIHNPIREE